MIKYSKFTEKIGLRSFTNIFCQNTNKFQKSNGGGGWGGVGGRREGLHPPSIFWIAHNFSFTENHYSVPFSFLWWLIYNASSNPCAIPKDFILSLVYIWLNHTQNKTKEARILTDVSGLFSRYIVWFSY